MATKPGHVAVLDFATATDENNLRDWVGTPVESAGVLAAPFVGTNGAQLIVQAGTALVTTNASGSANISFPAAFPNSLLGCTVSLLDVSTASSVKMNNTGTGTGGITITAYVGSATANSMGVRVSYIAVGT